MDKLFNQLDAASDINLVDHYDLYYQMFLVLYPPTEKVPLFYPPRYLWNDYRQKKQQLGYRKAYKELYQVMCVGEERSFGSESDS